MEVTPPLVNKIPKELTIHNHTRIDNYYWMREKDAPEVLHYLNKENAYTEAVLKDTEEIQDKLFEEIKGRIKQTDMSVPYLKKGYWYYVKYEDGKEYPQHCRKADNKDAVEEIILDVNELAKDKTYYRLGSYKISDDNKIVAYSEDLKGDLLFTIKFKNLETGETYSQTIDSTTGGMTWANDNKTIFYTRKEVQTLRPYRIFRRNFDDADSDEMVYEEKDETFNAYVYKSRSDKYIIIGSSATLTDECYILNANTPKDNIKLFHKRERGIEYSVGHFEDKFYIRTNWNAKNFRLMQTCEDATEKGNWTEVIPHQENVFFEGFLTFNKHLVLSERIKGITQLKVINQENKSEHYVPFSEETFNAWFGQNPEFETSVMRIGYTSLTTPTTTYDYNLNTKEFKLLKQQEVVGGYNATDYKSERIYAKASDGTEIPISLVYHKNTKINGEAPTYLYAYGSYGHSLDPYFSSTRLSLLNRGFVFAIAHIRGGEEMGRQWYENGKLLKKKNTFTDFIACSEFLIEQNYTSPKKLFASGGSAGGLLMGAVMNMKPEIYKGVIASVPFVDVVTTMLDESIPLTTGEYDEWGNPNNKEYYDYMLSYSPYDNVEAKDYPNILITTGYNDAQVQYWEPAKWTAKLRELKTDDNLLLFKIDMETGHSGASGRFNYIKEIALDYAFMFKLLGIEK